MFGDGFDRYCHENRALSQSCMPWCGESSLHVRPKANLHVSINKPSGNGQEVTVFNQLLFFVMNLSYNFTVRLAGGNDASLGRVEVLFGGTWGRVANQNWDLQDATVVCRQLGYKRALATLTCSQLRGLGVIWVDNFQCKGNESWISDCANNGWGSGAYYLWNNDDASVVCSETGITVQSFFQVCSGNNTPPYFLHRIYQPSTVNT